MRLVLVLKRPTPAEITRPGSCTLLLVYARPNQGDYWVWIHLGPVRLWRHALCSFTIGANDSAPEIIAIVLYGLTVLPSCILAIWFQKHAAMWLIALSPITAFGFIYQVLAQSGADKAYGAMARGISLSLVIAVIPGFLGILLLRTEHPKQML